MAAMKVEQAKAIVDEFNEKSPELFCPIINGTCRKDCVCFAEARVRTVSGITSVNDSYVVEGGCTNTMFLGE